MRKSADSTNSGPWATSQAGTGSVSSRKRLNIAQNYAGKPEGSLTASPVNSPDRSGIFSALPGTIGAGQRRVAPRLGNNPDFRKFQIDQMRGCTMSILKWAFIFFVISVIAGFLGFSGVSVVSADLARILFYIFVVIFLLLLVLGFTVFRA
jgi:uncharacterized membrane protein YtjA (UPF0391 family)